MTVLLRQAYAGWYEIGLTSPKTHELVWAATFRSKSDELATKSGPRRAARILREYKDCLGLQGRDCLPIHGWAVRAFRTNRHVIAAKFEGAVARSCDKKDVVP